MKIYIAGPWVKKPEVIAIAEVFKNSGFEVTSRWFNHVGDATDSAGTMSPIEHIREQAHEDIKDVLAADALVVLNLQKSEGKAVETGIAIANMIPVISVGPRGNIFQALGYEVETVEQAIETLHVLAQTA